MYVLEKILATDCNDVDSDKLPPFFPRVCQIGAFEIKVSWRLQLIHGSFPLIYNIFKLRINGIPVLTPCNDVDSDKLTKDRRLCSQIVNPRHHRTYEIHTRARRLVSGPLHATCIVTTTANGHNRFKKPAFYSKCKLLFI